MYPGESVFWTPQSPPFPSQVPCPVLFRDPRAWLELHLERQLFPNHVNPISVPAEEWVINVIHNDNVEFPRSILSEVHTWIRDTPLQSQLTEHLGKVILEKFRCHSQSVECLP